MNSAKIEFYKFSDCQRKLGEKVLLVLPLGSNISEFPIVSCLGLYCSDLWPGPSSMDYIDEVVKQCKSAGFSSATILGFGKASIIALALAIYAKKLTRRLLILDPPFRPERNFFEKTIDCLDGFSPLGIPFRAANRFFDPRPFLHAIFSPTLIISTAGIKCDKDANAMANMIPNSWRLNLKVKGNATQIILSKEFADCFARFIEIPPKRSQKRK